MAALSTLPKVGTASTTPHPGTGGFAVDEVIEYFSATQQAWIPAKVLAVNAHGTYNLDCKPDVLPDKIRRPVLRGSEGTFEGAEHVAGDLVEYYSATQGGWIPAKVLSANRTGTYDLDCKRDVQPDKIRKRTGRGSGGGNRPDMATGSSQPSRPPPARSTTGVPDITAPVQLLRVRREGSSWRYEVCQEGAEVLEQHGSRRVAVSSICGLYRTGKSYLLNMLLDRVRKGLPLFKVGGTTQACTEGLWLWGSVDSEDEQSPLLAFIDCEGFGSTESDKTRDAQLMTLCALLSSVMILNTKGALNEGMFNALALTCKFAEHIEEKGNEASRPALLWVLRDFMLELRDAGGCPITPDEYLEQTLHAAPAPGRAEERGQPAREIRQSLLKFFSHRSCATLVQPAIDEAQLQHLEAVPYTSLRSEFRAGVEALKMQLVATCKSNPKTIGGQPLGCYAFVRLMRQLVDAMNASKALSVKAAWDSVQHGACGALTDELRGMASRTLRMLASGQKLPGGAQLPMPDEALRAVLRDQRHALKAQWDERAIGEEAVRKEYWQELKETLAREEHLVRQSNSRVADQQLTETLKRWQDWLDDEDGTTEAGETISQELGQLMGSMPTAPISRVGRSAIECAARRVAAARAAVAATVEQSTEARRRAAAWGEQAAQQEGAAKSELETVASEIQDMHDRITRAQHSGDSMKVELQGKVAELQDAREQLQAARRDLEDARARDAELKVHHRSQEEREVSLAGELEDLRAAAAKAEAEKLASDRGAKAATEASLAEQARLQKELREVRAEVDRCAEQLASERAVLKSENESTRMLHVQMVEDVRKQLDAERSTLQGEHAKTRAEHGKMVEEARRQLDDERTRHAELLAEEQNRLLERERNAGVLEGQVNTLGAEATSLKDRITELQVCLREAEVKAGRLKQEGDRLGADLGKARAAVGQAGEEGEAKLGQQREEGERRLEEQRQRLKKTKIGCVAFRGKRAAAH